MIHAMNQAAFKFKLDYKLGYPAGFFTWLKDSQSIWEEFEKRALEMSRFRKRYSARTIIEVMRWHTDLKDTDKKFDLNNNFIPGLARYWMYKHGKGHPGFFKLRDSQGFDV